VGFDAMIREEFLSIKFEMKKMMRDIELAIYRVNLILN